MKKLLCIIIVIAMLPLFGVNSVFSKEENEKISVLMNGIPLTFDSEPFIENGRTFVPMRSIFEAFGASVEWYEETKSVLASKNLKTIGLQIGDSSIYIDGAKNSLDCAPIIRNDRTMIPVRAVAEGLDANVSWDENTKSVIITPAPKDIYIKPSCVNDQITSDSGKVLCRISANIPVVSSEKYPDAAQILNKTANSWTEETKQMAEDSLEALGDELTEPYIFDLDYKVSYYNGDIISYFVQIYANTGGVHPSTYSFGYVYSLKENRELTLSDFVDVTVAETRNFVREKFLESYFSGDNRYYEDADKLINSNEFGWQEYIDEKGFHVFVNPYELGPYASGIIDLTIPFKDGVLENMPNDNYSFESKLLKSVNTDSNYMISPFSIKCALMLAANGVSGEPLTELLNTLNISDMNAYNDYIKNLMSEYISYEYADINIANSIWLNTDNAFDSKFSDTYKESVKNFYNAEADEVTNADAAKKINSFISEATNGKIKDMISSSDFIAALVNAVYFNGEWQNKFNKNLTYKESFTNADGSVTETDFMHNTYRTDYIKTDKVEMVQMPYKGGRFSMYAAICDSDIDFDKDILKNIRDNKTSRYKVNISIPKFKSEFKKEINADLNNLGINQIFEYGLDKMFTNNSESYFIDSVIHQSFIEVDEEGTKAAAATVIMVGASSAPISPETIIDFKADKPFTYFIYDEETNEVLFVGRQNKM